MKQNIITQDKRKCSRAGQGWGVNYFFIHTTTWGIIKCEENGLEDVKKKWLNKDN